MSNRHKYKYKHLALGGTFDLLHKGHKQFLEFSFSLAGRVSIGITSDKMATKSGKIQVQSLVARRKGLLDFLKGRKLKDRAEIVVLDDIFGTTIDDRTIEGLVVTPETLAGGEKINKMLEEMDYKPLQIITCPMVVSDDGHILSSSRIRAGEINREGASYYKFLSSAAKFVLPPDLRAELAKPQGKIVRDLNQLGFKQTDKMLITVGDQITSNFVQKDILPNLSIVDFKINRSEIFTKLTDLGFNSNQKFSSVKNDPGTINKLLSQAVYSFFKKNQRSSVIIVDGEEDLAVLPVVLLAPLDSLVFYGQRNQGLVLVKVTEEKKSEFVKILARFKRMR